MRYLQDGGQWRSQGGGGGGGGQVLAFLMLPKVVEKLVIRLFDFLSQQKFHFTTSNAYSLSSEVNFKKVGHGCSNLTTAVLLLLQPHGAEQLAKKPTCKKSQTLDRFFNKISRPPTNSR